MDKSLLDSTLFNRVKVLSSHGIQAQYQESMKNLRRDIAVDPNTWILEPSETQEFIKVRPDAPKYGIYADKSGKMSDKSGKMDTKKRKENKSKINKTERKEKETAHAREPDDSFLPEKKTFGRFVQLTIREYGELLNELGASGFARCREAVDTDANAGTADWAALIRKTNY